MACKHKFYDYLALERLDFEPTTLIVGTFNPEWPEGNYAEWFYGRTSNNYFWDVLPGIFGTNGLRSDSPDQWKQFCKENFIALTDLICCIQDAEPTNENHTKILGAYTDSAIATKFKSQTPNNIVALLEAFPAIQSVYLTTTTSTGLWKRLWEPVQMHCQNNNIWCKQLMTPSKGARFFMKKNSGIKMPDFIFDDWKMKWQNQHE